MLGKTIAVLRKKKNMTQRDLGKALGVSTSAIAMWETGQREPDAETLTTIANYFEVSIDELLGREEIPTNKVFTEEIPPEVNVFFRDFLSAPEERKEEMLRFWRFIQENEKHRKPRDKQGE